MLKNNFKHVTSVKILEGNKVTNLSLFIQNISLLLKSYDHSFQDRQKKNEERKKE